nr:immunoglobulin heavy chain junction region [Macaca mulatta]MOW76415.1 immunoglobulin heavy chain junction region [Macaca mulatta]MOW77860.1 immunoglobulin heavy chain junction region [Macaca mulatta]MOW81318.1 immunoglobulin heavy chain junction region [Macaca mulatta]MOW81956.1 immunoglobulin heavy chain junction region [Macaca mulatta]
CAREGYSGGWYGHNWFDVW